MAKKEIRVVEAPEGIDAMIERGANIDIEMKNLNYEDKACKCGISEFASESMDENETSLVLKAQKASATVTRVESLKIETESDRFPELERLVKSGILTGLVECKRSLVVAPSSVDEAARVISNAGIGVSIVEDYGIKAADLRSHREKRVASGELKEATETLEKCITKKDTFRVTYKAGE